MSFRGVRAIKKDLRRVQEALNLLREAENDLKYCADTQGILCEKSSEGDESKEHMDCEAIGLIDDAHKILLSILKEQGCL